MPNSARKPAALLAGLLSLVLVAGCGPADAAGVHTPATVVPSSVAAAPTAANLASPPAAAPTSAGPTGAAPATTAALPNKAAGTPATAGPTSCRSDEYRNVSGHCVPRPTQAPAPPAGASAICNDGSYSFSEHRRGTCSGHGGVRTWLKDLPA